MMPTNNVAIEYSKEIV
uniref:Uncharacterized protein n=1 Tax=Arundo donax TaxID=35708 RepID=A0A0A9FVK8_ARUDO